MLQRVTVFQMGNDPGFERQTGKLFRKLLISQTTREVELYFHAIRTMTNAFANSMGAVMHMTQRVHCNWLEINAAAIVAVLFYAAV